MSATQDNALAALKKYCDDNNISELPPVFCRWCNDRGCISCAEARRKRQEQLDAEYQSQFPNGPQPIFTARRDKPDEMEKLKDIFHADVLKKTFGPDGGGIEEIERKCQEAMASRQSECEQS